MEFWIQFYLFIFFFLFIAFFYGKYARHCLYATLIAIWFIGAFRLNIGADYSTYQIMYDTWSSYKDGAMNLGEIEPAFYIICTVLNYCNMQSQSMFVIFETVTIIFLYKGLKHYIKDNVILVALIFLYAVYPINGGYWWDMNAMRQGAAISITFWGTHFLFEHRNAKFIYSTILATCFHYSAVIILLLCLVLKKTIPNRLVMLMIMMGFIMNGMGITASIVMYVMGIIAGIIGKYEFAVLQLQGAVGTLRFSPMALALVIIYYCARRMCHFEANRKSVMVCNGAAVYILLRVYMSFGIEESVMASVVHRIETYFLFFYFILIGEAIRNFLIKQSNKILAQILAIVFFLSFSILGLKNINNDNVNNKEIAGTSLGNIKYEFNFELY